MAMLSDLLDSLFGGDRPEQALSLGHVVGRSLIMYLMGLIIVRAGKSRLLARATALDVILAFLLGSLISRGITGSASLSGTTVAVATLVALHWVLTALAARYHWVGNLVKGHARVLVSNGHIDWHNMRRSHLSEHDLREEMRINANIDDFAEIQAAFKERSGEVSIVKKNKAAQVVETRVEDGVQTIRIEWTET